MRRDSERAMGSRTSGGVMATPSHSRSDKNQVNQRVALRQQRFVICEFERLSVVLVLLAVLSSVQCNQSSQQAAAAAATNDPDRGLQVQAPADRRQQTIPAANPNFEAAFQGECGKNNNSNPCEHICLDLHDGTYECSCFYGFTLAVDGYSCAHLAGGPVSPSPPDAAPSQQTTRSGDPRVSGGIALEDEDDDDDAAGGVKSLSIGGQQPPGPGNGVDSSAFGAQPTKASTKLAAEQLSQQRQQSANDNRKLADELASGGEHHSEVASSGRPWSAQSPVSSSSSSSAGSNKKTERPNSLQADYPGPRAAPPAKPGPGATPDANRITRERASGAGGRRPPPAAAAASDLHARPQMTTTPITGSGARGSSQQQQQQQQHNKGTYRARQRKRLTYDIERGDAASVPAARSSSGGLDEAKETDLIELGLDDIALEDLGPEVRSIMINNDKLVAQLARTVASLAANGEERAPVGESVGFEDPANELSMGADAIAPRRMAEERLQMNSSNRIGANIDGLHSTVATANGPESWRREDYEMNLLVNLVRRTMMEGGDNFGLDDMPETYGRQQRRAQSDHAHSGREINEPSSIPIGRDQSSAKEASPHRKRRSNHHSRAHAATDDERLDIGRGRDEATVGGGNGSHGSIGASSTSAARDRLRYATAAQTMKQSEVGTDNRGDSLSGSGCLHRGEQTADEVFRDCSEMPECEAGGQCHQETTWISRKSSDLAQLETRARCRCPIGRGGQLCQKPIQRSTPKFLGHSYLALPMITDPSITSLRLVFKPELHLGLVQPRSSLLLHSPWFLLLIDDMQRIELRYSTTAAEEDNISSTTAQGAGDNLGKITRVIGSQDADLDRWNELIVTDASSDSQINEQSKEGRIVLVTPDRIPLDRRRTANRRDGELFLAGSPDLAPRNPNTAQQQPSLLPHSAWLNDKSIGGFRGCVGELSINGRRYNFRSDLEGDALDGFDVVECCGKSPIE